MVYTLPPRVRRHSYFSRPGSIIAWRTGQLHELGTSPGASDTDWLRNDRGRGPTGRLTGSGERSARAETSRSGGYRVSRRSEPFRLTACRAPRPQPRPSAVSFPQPVRFRPAVPMRGPTRASPRPTAACSYSNSDTAGQVTNARRGPILTRPHDPRRCFRPLVCALVTRLSRSKSDNEILQMTLRATVSTPRTSIRLRNASTAASLTKLPATLRAGQPRARQAALRAPHGVGCAPALAQPWR